MLSEFVTTVRASKHNASKHTQTKTTTKQQTQKQPKQTNKDGQDARGQLHRQRDARRHAAGGARGDHGRVPRRHEPRAHHDGRVGARPRRAAGAFVCLCVVLLCCVLCHFDETLNSLLACTALIITTQNTSQKHLPKTPPKNTSQKHAQPKKPKQKPQTKVSLVINYDLPNNRELYIHRIGRSGRFGRKGVAINFVKADDVKILRDIEQYYSTQIDEMPMNGAAACVWCLVFVWLGWLCCWGGCWGGCVVGVVVLLGVGAVVLLLVWVGVVCLSCVCVGGWVGGWVDDDCCVCCLRRCVAC